MFIPESIKKAILTKFIKAAKDKGVTKIVIDITGDEPAIVFVKEQREIKPNELLNEKK